MAVRKTDPEPFPVRGTPTGYRDTWEADDRALIQAQIAEQERLLVAVRESAGPRRGGKARAPREPHEPTTPADRIATDP
jgi:hypothetical protein